MENKKTLLVPTMAFLMVLSLWLSFSDARVNPNKPDKNVLFSDSLEASPLWGNEVGEWTSGYFPKNPGYNPLTYTSLPYDLTNFEFQVTIQNISDGGIFLRSSITEDGYISGVYLVTGGHGGNGTGLYWQVAHHCRDFGGSYPNSCPGPITNEVTGLFTPGVSDARIRIVVEGNTYSAYVGDATEPATTLINNEFTSGKVALFGVSGIQKFSDVVLKSIQ